MNNSFSESYRQAGVDVTAGYRGVELMKGHVARTRTPFVLDSIGGFGGMLAPDLTGMTRPVLVSGTDGVGTKLKVAFLLDRHDTVGIDCVAMCVNDIICCGAEPLLFLDYIALGKNVPEKVAEIVRGVSEGCVQAGCALVGGETAEMPGFYAENEYDLAGFSVGMVDEPRILKPEHCREGDVLVALASSGVHSNGFSLVRKVFDIEHADLSRHYDELGGSLGETLLTPTKIYVKSVLQAVKTGAVHAISHITGGGFYENIPRMLPEGLTASVEKDCVQLLPIFKLLMQEGNIPERDMYNTFNMGVGMVLAVAADRADEVIAVLNGCGETAYPIGKLVAGERGVTLW